MAPPDERTRAVWQLHLDEHGFVIQLSVTTVGPFGSDEGIRTWVPEPGQLPINFYATLTEVQREMDAQLSLYD